MDNTFSLHVSHNFNHLGEEESSIVLTHSTDCLAQIEEEPASDVLEKDVNEIWNFSTRWFFNVSIWAITKNIYNVAMFKSLKNLYLLLNRFDRVSISLEELLSQKFESHLFSVLQRSSQVNFRSVTFSKRGEDFKFVVENWVLLFNSFHSVVLNDDFAKIKL